MSDSTQDTDADELGQEAQQEPSTEKELEEQPKKSDADDTPEPSHRAVGLGVVETSDPGAEPPRR